MEFNAKLSHVRVSARKVGLVADEVRGKSINDALNYLKFSARKRTAGKLLGLIKSAAANADQKGTVDVDTLVVKQIRVGRGPTLKRFMPRAKGSASPINKRTSHIWVTLAENRK